MNMSITINEAHAQIADSIQTAIEMQDSEGLMQIAQMVKKNGDDEWAEELRAKALSLQPLMQKMMGADFNKYF